MFYYALAEGDFWLPDTGSYHSFGLQAVRIEHGLPIVSLTVPDISTDKDFVLSLVYQFAFYQPDSSHLLDVLENLL